MNHLVPKFTRLRWVSASDPRVLERFCESIQSRIEIKEIIWDGKNFVMFFVPDDRGNDVPSGPIKLREQNGKRES